MARKAIPIDVTQRVLHEAGYKCSNPRCRYPITLDRHHIETVADGGSNDPENLLPLCPTCHAEYHNGQIPTASIRAWKMLLIALNEGFDRRGVDLLLLISRQEIRVTGDGLLECASLIASRLVEFTVLHEAQDQWSSDNYVLRVSEKGRRFVEGWKDGKQDAAIPTPASDSLS
jgi:hypothetical protein